MGKSSSAPSPDPRIGQAALQNAKLGREYLDWMKDQAAVTNQWAAEDRERYKSVFEPLQDQFIEEAQGYDTTERRDAAAGRSIAAVEQQAALSRQARERNQAAMGVDPRSGRADAADRRDALNTALAKAGAGETARRMVEADGRQLRAQAVNLGSGFAVNPATSMGLANSAMSSGFNGAMQGNRDMMNGLNMQWQQGMQQHSADQAASNSMWGGLGSMAGMGMFMLSSKDAKEDKRPARGVLDAVKDMPVEKWKYKDGMGDGGEHIGPYAEDFQAATGKGDGKTIPVVDAIGVTMGAVKELAEQVDGIAKAVGKKVKPRGIKEALA